MFNKAVERMIFSLDGRNLLIRVRRLHPSSVSSTTDGPGLAEPQHRVVMEGLRMLLLLDSLQNEQNLPASLTAFELGRALEVLVFPIP
jgi:hypothetical protein